VNRFAALLERLDGASDDEVRARVLADYLAATPDPDRGLALGLLLGELSTTRVGPAAIRALGARLDPVLLDVSLDVARDLSEAVALMWPGPTEPSPAAPCLPEIAARLGALDAKGGGAVVLLADWLDRLEPSARVALLRLATGRVAGLVPAPVAQGALALAAGAPLTEVEHIWHAAAPPYAPLFAWIAGGPRPSPASRAPFRPLVPVRRWDEAEPLDPGASAVEPAWSGLRVLAVAEAGERRLYSRRGVDVGARFPELLDALEGDVALEGVIVARGPDGRVSRAALDARLKRAPQRRTMSPAALMVHDALRIGGEDLRALPFGERRLRLEALFADLGSSRLALSPSEAASDWSTLRMLRRDARTLGAAGVVLKPRDAAYGEGAAWVEIRCEPLTLTGALLYVEYGLAGLEATIGVWNRKGFVPIAKAPITDDRDALKVADYAAESRADRFGPVIQVQANESAALLVEIAFDQIERAPRRKAGVVLHGARIVRLRPEAAPSEAAQLDDVRRLLG
jgi:DNA ligase-1